jgi:hypothetical protein
MAFFLNDIAKDPALLDKVRAPKLVCKACGSEAVYGGECEDCAYDELGKLVEEHPIPSAGIRRS